MAHWMLHCDEKWEAKRPEREAQREKNIAAKREKWEKQEADRAAVRVAREEARRGKVIKVQIGGAKGGSKGGGK